MTAPTVRSTATRGAATAIILARGDVRRLLDMPGCIDAVETAFRRHAHALSIPPGVLGAHVEGGGFHVKTAGMLALGDDEPPVFAAKINANFPGNPDRHGLPTIQGVLVLFDAHDGRPIALIDSAEITSIRTAAATAVAAKYLARDVPSTVTVCGCGEQSRHQLRALACVRTLRRVLAFDLDAGKAERLAALAHADLGVDVTVVRSLADATRETDLWVTCTTARRWFLGREHVRAGAFVAAVGADNPEKQEIEPELLAASTVVADVLEQCASIGELHHALDSGLMTTADVHAELADVVAGKVAGRSTPNEITIFDSTGTALEDVAAAGLVHRRAVAEGVGFAIDLGGDRAGSPFEALSTS